MCFGQSDRQLCPNTSHNTSSSFTAMSGNVRARRPPSPPPNYSHQRFPHPREGHLDADERRAAVSKGFAPHHKKLYPLGGLDITSGEWKLLAIVILLACGVRLYKLSKPNSVVYVSSL